MLNILKIAARNLWRYWRRTMLTAGLITIGVGAVILFLALAGSFKNLMVGQITDSYLGHLQIHKRGYVAAIETLPLNLNMTEAEAKQVDDTLARNDSVLASSPRVKFGAMLSNFAETTNIRVNGIDPAREIATSPELPKRVVGGPGERFLARGEIQLPELLAQGMKIAVGDTIVLVATNRDGSVNGRPMLVRGILSGVTGPGGRDGYVHIDDARELFRMAEAEVSEFAVRARELGRVDEIVAGLDGVLGATRAEDGRKAFEVHGWERLSPFSSIANMVDLMTLFIKVLLVSIVLIAVMNVMIMAVYERIREIGTISAIGTPPSRILALFVTEGLLLGIVGSAIGTAVSLALVAVLNVNKIAFTFGQGQKLLLAPEVALPDVAAIAGIVIVIAALASLQPAWKAARMDPIQALRHV